MGNLPWVLLVDAPFYLLVYLVVRLLWLAAPLDRGTGNAFLDYQRKQRE